MTTLAAPHHYRRAFSTPAVRLAKQDDTSAARIGNNVFFAKRGRNG
ncbi:hypothetical protein ACFQ4G_08990 [Methylobacterium marchantiae]|uniref:Uncharacterized protein n=1 Tax=Methylobacterium marchantiae TaxID=600331 RepID=A0ABW3WWL0_9HYPH